MLKKWIVKAYNENDYHCGAAREYTFTKLGAKIKSLKYRHYDHTKIERI
jgi:hypothetical protein